MWNRFLVILLLSVVFQTGFAQDWLLLSKDKILSKVEKNCQDVIFTTTTDTLIRIYCNEEDERCRVFSVSYQFQLVDGVCTSYLRILPVHNYWAVTILELIFQQEGEGSGDELDVDGVTLQTDYDFSKCKMHLKLDKDCLYVHYTMKK